jgi:hypothetical protein
VDHQAGSWGPVNPAPAMHLSNGLMPADSNC